jgi:hypothetical protein
MKIKIPMTLTIDIPDVDWCKLTEASNQLNDNDDLILFYESFGVDLDGTIS